MNDEQLIGLVRSHPALYDPEHKKYMENNFKTAIWNDIGRELGASPISCKKRWCNIRDNFRKSIYKNATRSSQGQKVVKPYRYYDQLSFMIKYTGTKNNTENIRDSMTDSNDELSAEPIPPPLLTLQELTSPPSNTSFLYTRPSSTPASDLEDSDPLSASDEGTRRRRSKRRRNTSRSGSAEMLDYLIRQSEHPVDAFLASISPTLKQLHPCDWFEAKAELFAMVQKYEAKLLSQKFANKKDLYTKS